MEPMASIALRAARLAGQRIARAFDRPDLIKVSDKGSGDYVTNIDKDAQFAIIDHLKTTYPAHSFLGEEDVGNTVPNDSGYQWVIDPIDGTNNFVHNIPHFCISIACIKNGKLEHAVILDPLRQEEFVASRGKGCQYNGRRVRVSDQKYLDGAVVSTGGAEREHAQAQGAIYTALLEEGAVMRQAGSAALDLAWVASGRLDAMWMSNLKLWDIAAGVLMVQEAGGILGELNGGQNFLKTGNIVAAGPKVFRHIAPIIKKHYS